MDKSDILGTVVAFMFEIYRSNLSVIQSVSQNLHIIISVRQSDSHTVRQSDSQIVRQSESQTVRQSDG